MTDVEGRVGIWIPRRSSSRFLVIGSEPSARPANPSRGENYSMELLQEQGYVASRAARAESKHES